MSTSHDLIVVPQERALVGSVPLSPDESITPFALLTASLADGRSEVLGASWGERTQAMIEALRKLGIAIDVGAKGIFVEGRGLYGFVDPGEPIDCGAWPTTMRWLSGVLVGQSFASTLTMAPAFAPMEPLAKALRWRGGLIEGVFLPEAPGRILPPLTVGPLPGGVHLSELEFEIGPMESDVKGAALLSGLYSDGATYLREPLVSCDHAERRLQALDVPVATAGSLVELEPAQWSAQLPTVSHRAVGDAGAAALLLVAAALVPESQVSARDAGLNPTRGGALSFLRRMGGQFAGEVHAHIFGEPAGIASSAWAPLRATAIDGEDALRAADDIGVLAALAARAEGVSTIAAPTLSEGKIEALAAVLRSFGVDVETSAAGFTVEGRPNGRLRAAEVDAGDEVDLATLSVLLGLVANGPSRVRRVDGLARRFPRIVGTLRALGADLRVSAASEAT